MTEEPVSAADEHDAAAHQPVDHQTTAADLVDGKPAGLPPAETVTPAGAPDQIVPDVDLANPAVDANPRANTSERQNKIDFNDPTLSGQEAVERALAKQRDA